VACVLTNDEVQPATGHRLAEPEAILLQPLALEDGGLEDGGSYSNPWRKGQPSFLSTGPASEEQSGGHHPRRAAQRRTGMAAARRAHVARGCSRAHRRPGAPPGGAWLEPRGFKKTVHALVPPRSTWAALMGLRGDDGADGGHWQRSWGKWGRSSSAAP